MKREIFKSVYKCSHCGDSSRNFARKEYLQKHLKGKHKVHSTEAKKQGGKRDTI